MENVESCSSSDALFPTLLADPEPTTVAEPIVALLRMVLKKIDEVPVEYGSARKEASLEMVRALIRDVHLHYSHPLLKTTGQVLRAARNQAQLSGQELADRSGVSLRTIRAVEKGTQQPTSATVSALCAVPEMGLVPPDMTRIPRFDASGNDRANFIVTQGFDPLGMHAEMKQILNSSGGALEQSHVYLDYESAQDWLDLCDSPGYVAMYRYAFPHREAAKRLAQLVGKAGMDLIMLGPGDGKTEVQFAQHVLGETEDSALRVYLLDASQPLLNRAYAHAVEMLGRNPRVTLWPMQGTFFQLARYKVLNAAPYQMHRRRVYTIFGNTIANLDNEASFLRSSFSGAVKGDVLIFDADHAYTKDVQDPGKIRASDPAFLAPIRAEFERWLVGPVWRHCPTAQPISMSLRVDADRLIAGSYGFQFVASIKHAQSTREFILWNVRRYNLDKLSELVQRLGWAEVGRFAFSSTERPRSLLMFQKL